MSSRSVWTPPSSSVQVSNRAVETFEMTADITRPHYLEQLRLNRRNVYRTARVPDQSKLIANRAYVIQIHDASRCRVESEGSLCLRRDIGHGLSF
jgi:hypothetical protein